MGAAFSDTQWKYKSPSNRSRDKSRRKWQNVNKNSKSVSTFDEDRSNQPHSFNVCQEISKTPTCAPKKKTNARKKQSVSSAGRGSMVLRSGYGQIEQKRNFSEDSCVGNFMSPESVQMSPECFSMTMSDHVGRGQNSLSMAMESPNINNNKHGQSMISDHDDHSDELNDSSSEGSIYDTDSNDATDLENNCLGQSGLSICEYGPSVDEDGVNVPRSVLQCTRTECGWIV